MMKIFETGLISSDVKNENGRIYPKELLKEIHDNINNQHDGLYGELNHPEDFYASDLREVSHFITGASIDDSFLDLEITILDTPKGKILQADIDKYVFRPRGTGEIDEDGNVFNYKLITFDAVLAKDDAFKNLLK